MYDSPIPVEVNRHTFAAVRRLKAWRGRDRATYLAVLLGTAAVGYLWLTAPPPSITRENYDRVRPGMTEREVEQVFGTRPGGYGSGYLVMGQEPMEYAIWGRPVRGAAWLSKQGFVEVGYDTDGRVTAKALHALRACDDDPAGWPWWRRLMCRPGPGAGPAVLRFGPF